MGRPKGPYGNELLWGDEFIERYRDALEDLYLTPEVRNTARDVHFGSFTDGEHSIAMEKSLARAAYGDAGYRDELYAFGFIVKDVVGCGYSPNSATISIHAYIMLVETGVLDKPSRRHHPVDPFAATSDEGAKEPAGADGRKEPNPAKPVRKCSNCAFSRNPNHCSQMAVCEEWRYAEPTPDYYPKWEDMRGGMYGDYLSRRNDTYLSQSYRNSKEEDAAAPENDFETALEYLRSNPSGASEKQIAKDLEMSDDYVSRLLRILHEQGRISRKNSEEGGLWIVADEEGE